MKNFGSGSQRLPSVGDIVTFGTYEQDDNLSNGKEPIEWIILDVNADGSYVMISKYALDCKPYNTADTDVTWETCTLRKWLNEDFYNAAFSAQEQAKIRTVKVVNEDNPSYGTKGGNDTEDRVWLLSINEVCDYFNNDKVFAYFTDDASRICYSTAHAKAQGAYTYNGACWWWLRSPGYASWAAAYVYHDGYVYSNGYNVGDVDDCGNYVYSAYIGVRPVVVVLP